MAVKIHCSMCETFIRDVGEKEFRTITGKEICKICEDKLNTIYSDIEYLKKEVTKTIEKQMDDLKKQYAAMIAAFNKFQADVVSLVSTAKAAIDAAKQDVLK